MDVKQGIVAIIAAKKAIPLVNKPKDTITVGEILSERTENAKVFSLGGNKRQAKIYTCPIHFKDADGSFKSIDPTVKRKPLATPLQTYQYEVKSGIYHAHFKADKFYDYRLEVGESFVEYEAMFTESASLSVQVETSRVGVKETITLIDNKASTSLSWRVSRAGAGIVTPLPTARDAKGKDVSVKVTEDNGVLTYDVDVTDAVFPIVVDPTSIIATTDGHILGLSAVSYANSRNTGTSTASYWTVGQDQANWMCWRSLASFAIPDMATLTAASLFINGQEDASANDFDINLYTSTYASIAIGDFTTFDGYQNGAPHNGTILNDTWNTSSYSAAWNEIIFNAAGLAAILAKKNDTFKMAAISSDDVANTTTASAYVSFRGSATAGEEPYLSITYIAYRNMAGQSDISFDAVSSCFANRNLQGQANIVFDAVSSCFADRSFSGQANMVFDALLLLSRTFDMAGQANMVFDAIMEMYRNRNMAGQANITINKMADWQYRKKITIDQTKIDADLTDYTVTILLTAANFDFTKALSTGYDIRFTAADDITLLTYRRASHNAVAQTAEYKVKVPLLSQAADTIIKMYYGNSAAADGSSASGAFDTSTVAAYSMDDVTTSSIADLTGNGNNGTKIGANEPIEVAGQVGKAQQFDGSNDIISCGSTVGKNLRTGTASFLVKATNSDDEYVIDTGLIGFWAAGWTISKTTTITFVYLSPLGLRYVGNPTNIADGQYHYVSVAFDSDLLTYTIKVDDVVSSGTLVAAIATPVNLLKIGWTQSGSGVAFTGLVDEVRISNISRSAAWIKAEYNDLNGTLLSIEDDDLNIIPMLKLYAIRNMTGQADVTFDTLALLYAIRNMSGQADIVFDALLLAYAIRYFTAQADIELSTYCFMGIDGDSGLVTRY